MIKPNTTQVKCIQDIPVPEIGFGTWILQGEDCRRAVDAALQSGYRHLDTARIYENEFDVGNGMKRSNLDREDFFLTSKIWFEDLAPGAVEREVHASLQALKTDYLDLVLIHWPNPDQPLSQTFDILLRLQEQTKIRRFGVSNFTPQWLNEALRLNHIFCNQIEMHPMLRQKHMRKLARENNILLTAYSPLAQGNVHGKDELAAIADKHKKTPEQVALRWLIEQPNVAAIPRSANPEHIEQNIDIYDFSLDEEDLQTITQLPDGERQINPDFAPDWNN